MEPLRSKDLRLGNLVLFRGKICKVTTLSGDIIRVDEPEVGIIEQAYAKSPIPLTPEILEACGFVLDRGIGVWFCKEEFEDNFNFTLWDDHNGKYLYSRRSGGPNIQSNIVVQYLHQLQNLYYSLTGEELTISLPTVKMEGWLS